MSWLSDTILRNVAGGVLWATAFVLLGFAAGPAWRAAERIAGQGGLVLLGTVVVGAAAATLVRRWRRRRRGQPAPDRRVER